MVGTEFEVVLILGVASDGLLLYPSVSVVSFILLLLLLCLLLLLPFFRARILSSLSQHTYL